MPSSFFERFHPVTVALLGGLVSVLASLGLTVGTVHSVGLEAMNWGWVVAVAVLCPALIAPPIIYFQCQALRQIARQKSELIDTNRQLHAAREQVDELSQMLPLCAWCHRVRDDRGYWERVEEFIERSTRRSITHGICPECRDREMSTFTPPQCTHVS